MALKSTPGRSSTPRMVRITAELHFTVAQSCVRSMLPVQVPVALHTPSTSSVECFEDGTADAWCLFVVDLEAASPPATKAAAPAAAADEAAVTPEAAAPAAAATNHTPCLSGKEAVQQEGPLDVEPAAVGFGAVAPGNLQGNFAPMRLSNTGTSPLSVAAISCTPLEGMAAVTSTFFVMQFGSGEDALRVQCAPTCHRFIPNTFLTCG